MEARPCSEFLGGRRRKNCLGRRRAEGDCTTKIKKVMRIKLIKSIKLLESKSSNERLDRGQGLGRERRGGTQRLDLQSDERTIPAPVWSTMCLRSRAQASLKGAWSECPCGTRTPSTSRNRRHDAINRRKIRQLELF